MRQFGVCPNPSTRTAGPAPYVVVLQSHLILDAMPTVVIAPMFRPEIRPAYSKTNATVLLRGEAFVVAMAELAAPPARLLRTTVGSLAIYEDELRKALSYVFLGF